MTDIFRAAFAIRVLSSYLKVLIVFCPGVIPMSISSVALLTDPVFATLAVSQTARVTHCLPVNTAFGTHDHARAVHLHSHSDFVLVL